MTAPLIVLVGGAVVLAGGRLVGSQRPWLPVALLTLAFAAASLLGVFGRDSTAAGAPNGWLVHDSLTLAMHWLAVGLGVLIVLASCAGRSETDRVSDRLALVLLSIAGLMLAAAGHDLVLTFVAVELVSLATAATAWLRRTDFQPVRQTSDGLEIRPAALLPGAVSSIVLLLGFTFLYGLTASTRLSEIGAVLAASYGPADATLTIGRGSLLGVAAVVLIFTGLGWRLAVVPFHVGLIELWEVDQRSAILLTTVPRATAFVVLVRVVVDAMPGFEESARQMAMLLAGLTLVVAGVRALSRPSLRPMLGDLLVAQGGFALIGVAAALAQPARETALASGSFGAPGGTAAAFIFLAVSLTASTGLLAGLLSIEPPRGEVEDVDDLAGLARTRPGTAVCLAVCLLCLAGLPPLAGFWGRWLVVFSALTAPAEASASGVVGLDAGFVLLVLASAVGTLLAAAVVIRLLEPILLVGPRSRPLPITRRAAVVASVFATVALAAASMMPGRATSLLVDGSTSEADGLGAFFVPQGHPKEAQRFIAGVPDHPRPRGESRRDD